ncbi:cerebellin 20 [Alosa sapidissima]|uniref:cerebellin 20 n=1 Tax=Alosa sapidissima TaxID=34773 RepID=UPI001C099794|nr:cerebellin 20 [Alosa sapidissima]
MRAIVMLCLLGVAVANDPYYSWNGPNGKESTDPATENVCLMDTASCGCCLMQKQMWRMETFFNMSLSQLQRDLERAEAALHNLRASRSAFSVALTDTRRCLGPFREATAIRYEVVFLNLGAGYNTSTGIFTAPRAGVYSLALTVYSDAGSPGAILAACARLRRNGSVLAAPSENNTQDQEDSTSVTMAVQLNAGDRVDVTLPAGCFLCDSSSHFNTFTGFLLYATD